MDFATNLHIRHYSILFLTITLMTCGCALTSKPGKDTLIVANNFAPKNSDELITHINTNAEAITTIKASGNITLFEGRKKYVYPLTVFFKKPNSFYLEGHTPQGTTLFHCMTEDGEFNIFLPGVKRIITGKNETLKNDLTYEINLKPHILLAALFAGEIEAGTTAYMKEMDSYFTVTLLKNNTRTRTIEINKLTAKSDKELFFSKQGFETYEIKRTRYAFDDDGKTPIAHTIFITNTVNDVTIKLDFDHVALNKKLKDDLFTFEFPAEMDVEEVW